MGLTFANHFLDHPEIHSRLEYRYYPFHWRRKQRANQVTKSEASIKRQRRRELQINSAGIENKVSRGI